MKIETSLHYKYHRAYRDNFIKQMGGYGKVVETFAVDKGHRQGSEVHAITSNGFVIVMNRKTYKVCTIFIATPHKLKSYYKELGRNDWDANILMKAHNNSIAYKNFKANIKMVG